jgi:hypothetical protein
MPEDQRRNFWRERTAWGPRKARADEAAKAATLAETLVKTNETIMQNKRQNLKEVEDQAAQLHDTVTKLQGKVSAHRQYLNAEVLRTVSPAGSPLQSRTPGK